MKKMLGFSAAIFAAALVLLSINGCTSSTTPPDPAKIAALIKVGTSSTVSIGLVAIPDATEANEVATLSAKVLDENILPLLAGDEEGLVNGLKSLLELKAFEDPKLAKFKLIVEVGLPILEGYLPPDLVDQPLDKMPPNVRAYLVAFFQGVRDGVAAYQGNSRALRSKFAKQGFNDYADLRAKLNAK
jgi:hypothetical protein